MNIEEVIKMREYLCDERKKAADHFMACNCNQSEEAEDEISELIRIYDKRILPLSGMDSTPCLICQKPVPGYEPERCCDGFGCSCMAMPTNPCVCSDACGNALFDINGSYEDRRQRHGIARFGG